MNNYLWVFFKYDISNNIIIRRLDSSGVWSSLPWTPVPTPNTDASPSAVVMNNKIYLFYKAVGTGSQRIYYVTWDPSSGWLGPYETPIYSDYGPVAVNLLDTWIHVFYKYGSTGQNLKYRYSYPDMSWSDEYSSGVTPGAPAAAVFKDRLHVAVKASNNTILYSSFCYSGLECTYRPGAWTLWVQQDGGARNFVSFVQDDGPYGGSLYLFHRGQSTNLLYWRSKDSE